MTKTHSLSVHSFPSPSSDLGNDGPHKCYLCTCDKRFRFILHHSFPVACKCYKNILSHSFSPCLSFVSCHVKSSLHVIVVPPVCPHIIALIQCRFISQFLRKSPSRPGHAIRWQVHIRFVSIIPGYPQSTRLTSSCLNNNFIL